MFKQEASQIFGRLEKVLKKLELEMDYQHDIKLDRQKYYQESLSLIASLEQLVMNHPDEQDDQELDNSLSFDDKDHDLLMHQLRENINLVNDYKSQIQEIRRQNQLIGKLATQQTFDNPEIKQKRQRNDDKIREIHKNIISKQRHLKTYKDPDYRLLTQIERLDDDIEQITQEIRQLL